MFFSKSTPAGAWVFESERPNAGGVHTTPERSPEVLGRYAYDLHDLLQLLSAA